MWDTGTVQERLEDLQQHVKLVHNHAKELKNQKTNDTKAEAARVEAEAKKLQVEVEKYRTESGRLLAELGSTAGSATKVEQKERRAPMKCPTVEENFTKSDWSFFTAEWGRYVAAVGLDGDIAWAVRHLWAPCSDGLWRALHNDGAQSETVVANLFLRVKSLAVKRRNNLVNIMTSTRWFSRGRRGPCNSCHA